jgi:pyruvate dehydrogenase E1 component
MGGTAGRTTLEGEGLQHQDGHSHLAAAAVPNCVAYDPTFAFELAVIVQDGLRRMYVEQERVFYYVTIMNENYQHPPMPDGAQEGILKGMYRLKKSDGEREARVQLLGAGTILREALAAAQLLEDDFDIGADVWSAPSFTLLRRDGIEVQRWNRLHPGDEPRISYVEQCLADTDGPVIAASDYVRAFADQIRPFVPRSFTVLGTDGYGRSDTRTRLRQFFEVDRHHVAVAALKALADEGTVSPETVSDAIARYSIDTEKPAPWTV